MKKKEFLKNLKKKKKKNSKKNPWNNFTPRLLRFVKIATGGAKYGHSYFVQSPCKIGSRIEMQFLRIDEKGLLLQMCLLYSIIC